MGNRDDVIAYIPMWVQHVPASAKAPEAPETPPNA
jgi:hypothetical protein